MLAFQIARRYILSKKNTQAINILSWITLIGIAVISFAFLVILSVFNGFEGLVVMLFNTFNPDIKVTARQGKVFTMDESTLAQLRKINTIEAVTVSLEENALLRNSGKQYIARMKGVDENFSSVNKIRESMVAGQYTVTHHKDGYSTAVLGSGVEAMLGIDVENPMADLDLFIPSRTSGSSTLDMAQAFHQNTIFPVGAFAIQQDFDSKYFLVPLDLAQSMLEYENHEISSVEIKVKSQNAFEKVQNVKNAKAEIAKIIDTKKFKIANQQEQDESLYKVIRMEKWLVFALLSLVLIIASFNISTSLSMLVIEKQKDVAILKHLGATPRMIAWIFLFTGMLLSLLGAAVGLLLGAVVCLLQQYFHIVKFMNSGTFVVDAYPVILNISDVLLVLLLVISIGIIASLYPAIKISKNSLLLTKE